MHDESDTAHAPPSKTRLKQEAKDLQQLGTDLLDVAESEWLALQLPERLIDALRETRRTPPRGGARKRQLQYLGKIMRETDAEPIREFFRQRGLKAQRQIDAHHRLEHWRDRLIEESDAVIEEFLQHHPEADRQHLRQLVRQAHKERDQHKPPKSSRALFRYLRDLAGQEAPGDSG
jgi:ribosome-associated protein